MSVRTNAARLLMLLFLATLSGTRRVIVGVHVNLALPPYYLALLVLYVKLRVLGAVHCVNLNEAEDLRARLRCPVLYIPNGVECSKFCPGTKNKEFTILFVGALTKTKGADLLPEIYSILKRDHEEIVMHLVIATPGGELGSYLGNWSKKERSVEYKGFVTEDELASLYRESTVVLLPSRKEPFGLVALEAQASGTPVIVSGASGFRQTVLDEETGFIVADYSPSAFANMIARVYDEWSKSRTEYYQMCDKAREHVLRNFSWPIVMQQLERLFTQE
ncbi:MAG: glycosyltransferase family 4 protein [Nitrososphaerota archaeon]|nr:glycosyltransferase family 4 protein [Nitrososphaerota archaeon]